MKNLPRKVWKPSLTLKEAADLMIDWCKRAREKNIILKKPPKLYYSYVVEGSVPFDFMTNVSQIFRYSQKDMPYIDQSRDSLLRCLSIALKAHCFLFENDKVAHEPYFFTLPNLADINRTIYGLVYTIEKENKTIIVCEKNIENLIFSLTDTSKVIYPFPAVLTKDSFIWYKISAWKQIKLQTKEIDGLTPFDKPWENKSLLFKARDAKSQEELLKYATVLDIPYEIKDYIKPLGVEWSKAANTWYLPLGFDKESVNEYIDYIKEITKKEEEVIKK